jgi:DNA-binding NarL/FixJ family response regulator
MSAMMPRMSKADAARWRAETSTLLRGLGEAVSTQFDRWALTPAEQEVALLLIKGLSHKEVAQVRGTSERTVRQQALAIYKKAGVGSKAELSAFFLEDLLLPIQQNERRVL